MEYFFSLFISPLPPSFSAETPRSTIYDHCSTAFYSLKEHKQMVKSQLWMHPTICLFYAYYQSSLTLVEKNQVSGLASFLWIHDHKSHYVVNTSWHSQGMSPSKFTVLFSKIIHTTFLQSTFSPLENSLSVDNFASFHLRKQKTSKTPLSKHINPSAPIPTTSLPSLVITSIPTSLKIQSFHTSILNPTLSKLLLKTP